MKASIRPVRTASGRGCLKTQEYVRPQFHTGPVATAAPNHVKLLGDENMKVLVAVFFLLILPVTSYGQARTKQTIELTRDNPSTLISTNSSAYTIFGFRLGMSPTQARKVLRRNKMLVAERDRASRIYVYDRAPHGTKGKTILYLIWEPDRKRLEQITIFDDCGKYLKPNFARLLTSEALSDSSLFKQTFIGDADQSAVTLDVPSIGLKNTTYFYETIGIEVTLVHLSKNEEHVVFALVAKPSK
jgi:hypothetical protein